MIDISNYLTKIKLPVVKFNQIIIYKTPCVRLALYLLRYLYANELLYLAENPENLSREN